MKVDCFVHDRLVVARLRRPDPSTSQALADLVERRHQDLGQALVFVLIIGTDCPMPTTEGRRQLAADQLRVRACCAEARTLILGRELRQSLVRSLVTGFAMLPGGGRPKLDGSVDELLVALESRHGLDPQWLRRRLIERHVVSLEETSWHAEGQRVTWGKSDIHH